MKKTIITLMALGSCSMGAELVAEWNGFKELTSTVGTNSYELSLIGGTGGSSVGDDYVLNLDNSTVRSATIDLSAANLSMDDGVTVSLTVSNWRHVGGYQPDCVWSVNTSDTDNVFATTYSTDYSKGSFAYYGSASRVQNSTNTGNMSGNKGASMSVLGTDTKTLLTVTIADTSVVMYQDGTEVLKCNLDTTSAGSADVTDETFKTMFLGCWDTGNNGRGKAKLYDLAIYKGAMTATEVKALTVPEPTTATLSLLALAGLAARRRRR